MGKEGRFARAHQNWFFVCYLKGLRELPAQAPRKRAKPCLDEKAARICQPHT